MYFGGKFLQQVFCSLNIVWMYKISCVPQKIIFMPQKHPSKLVYKNMLKARSFIKKKLCYRCFDNYLLKVFRTNILETSVGDSHWKCTIFTLYQGDISIWIFRTVLDPRAEAHSGRSQASTLDILREWLTALKNVANHFCKTFHRRYLWPVLIQAINCFKTTSK